MSSGLPSIARVRPLEWACVAAIVFVALGLRVSRLDLMEFKGDEAQAIELTLPIFERGEWPEVGLVSSVQVHNPPLFLYLVALPMTLTFNPMVVTGLLVGGLGTLAVLLCWAVVRPRFGALVALTGAAMMAVSPWVVLYNRKVWAQDVLPIFTVLTLHVLFALGERRKTWLVAALPVLLCAMWQTHFSVVALGPVVLLVLLLSARDLAWGKLALGTVVGLLMLWPYLHYQRTHDWEDLRGFRNLAAGKRPDGSARPPKAPLSGSVVTDTFHITGGARFDYALGPSTEAYEQSRGPAANALRSTSTWLAWLSFAGGLGVALWRALRGARRVAGWPLVSLPAGGQAALVVAVWVPGVWAIWALAHLELTFPHYHIIAYPVPFVLGALALGAVARAVPRFGTPLAVSLASLVIAGHLESLTSFARFLDRTGGTAGDYGVTYGHKAALTRHLVANGLDVRRAPGWEYPFLVDKARAFSALGSPASFEPATDIPSGYRHVDIHDTVRDPNATHLQCRGGHDFGPLKTCPVP